jgi:pSer/pThr/pTyr-binding forkhead associated (FHA) protein
MTDTQRMLRKNSSGAVIPIGSGLTVGRGQECGLRLTEGSPSRLHAQLGVADNQPWVEDLGSTNGTFVNGVRITARTTLRDGDALRFDVEEFTYGAGAADADRTVLRQPASPAVSPAVAVPTPAQQLPPGWTEGAGHGAAASRTVFKSAQELSEERRRTAAAAPAREQSTTDVPVLLVVAGATTASRLELRATGGDKHEWNIGSDAARDLCLPASGVSALHARIVRDGERWKIIDQVSANGTFVNGKRCTVSYLNSGDRVAFGPVECSFLLPDDSGSGGAVRSDAAATAPRGGWSPWRITFVGVVSFLLTLLIVYALMK